MPLNRSRRSSLVRRAMLALLLTVGFYALALVMMGLLVLVAWEDLTSGRIHFQIVGVALMGFLAILVSIIPRSDRFDPPWPRMTAEQHPLLFAKLESIAAAANQRMPDEVYLLPDLNAWVSDRGRGGRRRVMGIGLPLIHLLDVSQFSAVIAHEFGHYYGGDTRLGPWIHKTRAAIGRTLQNLNEKSVSIVEAPFRAYGRMFMRVTMSVSREQEYTADRFAASIAGAEAMTGSLKRLAGYSPGVGMYWNGLLLPALASGYRPSVVGGLTLLLFSKDIADAARHVADKAIEQSVADPFDTHPCLRDRLAALEGLPRGHAADSDPAVTLLGELLPVEDQIVNMYMAEENIAKLKPIEWDEVGERVFVGRWTELRDRNRALLESWTVDEMGAVLDPRNCLAAEVIDADGHHADPEDQPGLLCVVAHACLSLALREAGWTFVARPDLGIFFARGEKRVDAEYMFDSLLQGSVSQSAWADICNLTGMTGLRMSGGMSPTGPGKRWLSDPRTIQFVPQAVPVGVRYEGGNGASIDVPIIIRGARDENELTTAEARRLREWYGVEGADWHTVGRTSQEHQGRRIDVIEIEFKNGRRQSLYFDVTEWAGRLV